MQGLSTTLLVLLVAFGRADPPVISLKAPALTEEEEGRHVLTIPDDHLCDACIATSWQLSQYLKKKEELFTAGEKLSEMLLVETLETACGEGTKGYGIKAIGDTHNFKVFSGPGIPSKDVDGAVMMHTRWDVRMKAACLSNVEELGEMEIYEAYIANIGEENPLKDFFCRNKDAESRNCNSPGMRETNKEVLQGMLAEAKEQELNKKKGKKGKKSKRKKTKKGKKSKRKGSKKAKKEAKKKAKKEAKKAKKASKKKVKKAGNAANHKMTWDE